MNGKDILDIIDCIRNNDSYTTNRTVELIDKVMRDCKAKEVGELLIKTLNKKEKELEIPKKRGRGRPRKELTENQKKMVENTKVNKNYE